MKFFILTSVLAACTASSLASSLMNPPATNDCCPCYGVTCADGTTCTPYCGYGKCNIFGCNCNGGCRRSIVQSKQQSLESFKSNLEAGEASEFFDATDANKDGIITMEEWLDSPVRSTASGETCATLVKQWAKFDPENVGYLTKHQAINRKA